MWKAFLRTQYTMANMKVCLRKRPNLKQRSRYHPAHIQNTKEQTYEMEMNKPENGLKSQQTKRGEILEGREKSPPADELNFVRAKVI